MKTSPNNSHQSDEASTHSTSFGVWGNNQQSGMGSGIASMLSPRNIMKLFTKNVQQADNHQQSLSFNSKSSHNQRKFTSNFKPDQIHKEFGNYINAVSMQMQKYHSNHLKAKHRQLINQKQNEKREIQQQVKLSKIPQQYFQQWHNTSQVAQQEIIASSSSLPEKEEKAHKDHKSLKLQTLLRIGEQNKERKKSKQKRKPLQQKQYELEGYLDDIELIIYNKTRKYPDRYLHYLVSLNDSDIEVVGLVNKVKQIRKQMNHSLDQVNLRYKKIKTLEIRRKKISQVVDLMNAMKEIHSLKKQSQNFKSFRQSQKNSKQNTREGNVKEQKKSSREIMKTITQHPRIGSLYLLQSITQTLQNVEQLGKTIRSQRFLYGCDLLTKSLLTKLSGMYSREMWLRSQLPKDSVMVHKMKPEIQAQVAQQHEEEGNMNNSYMNISILDQSYCVGSHQGTSKKEAQFSKRDIEDAKEIKQQWEHYCKEYEVRGRKMEQQDQQINQILHRAIIKFSHTFHRDLEDYINYIYAQKFPKNPRVIETFKQRIWYIQPKLFNKIGNVYFQALSTIFKYSLTYVNLPCVCQKLLGTLQQKISQFMGLKGLNQYLLILNNSIDYQDVSEVLSSFDFWLQFVQDISNRYHFVEGEGSELAIGQKILQFQQNINKMKHKFSQEFLNNLHKFALTSDLKNIIEQDSFQSISIPVTSFWILDFIINWGQAEKNAAIGYTVGSKQQVEESFCYGSSILNEVPQQNKKSFSIFRCIDKKLIIEGKQFRICHSLLFLSAYLQVYLRAKTQWPELLTNIDERICELIGFYIWYCKKTVMSSTTTVQHQQTHNKQVAPTKINFINTKKTVGSLSMVANNCELLTKFIDILQIISKPKKVDKAIADLKLIKQEAYKQLGLVPFMQIERQISCIYESRLKTRKQIPTKESVKIIEVLEQTRADLSKFFGDPLIKKFLQNSMKIINKNYFGYLHNMEARGKSELRWFIPRLKQTMGDLFIDEVNNLEKQLRY